jgi:SET domain-containing protein
MVIIPPTKVYVSESPVHGWGVFASSKIEKGEIIEVCPVHDLQIKHGESSPVLLDYRFNWPQGTRWEKQVIPWGYGALYNHSDNANANWRSNVENGTFEFYATEEILPGQEIFTWYGDDNYWNHGRAKLS